MDTAFQAYLMLCLVGIGSSQLFPFSTLHQHALKEMSSSTESAPAASIQRVRIETNERPSRSPSGSAKDPLTVLVTPRPKYRPQNFVQEPSVGPNNANIPSMMDEKSIQERMKTHQHRLNHESTPQVLKPQRGSVKTIVDSVPSLSVVIPHEVNSNGHPIEHSMDFLKPPRYPSIYNNKPTLADFDTTPLRNYPKGNKEHKYSPHKEWHRKPDKKQNFKRKIRGKTTESNIHLESQIQWGPSSSGSLDTFTHKTPSFHLDPYYEQFVEHVIQEPQSQYTTFREYEISSDGYISSPTREWTVKPGHSVEEDSTRVNYQLKGHKGPETYKFGYDTGHGDERMFRFEEKDEDGSIKGQYGYYDKYGRLQIVKYVADKNGFRAFPS